MFKMWEMGIYVSVLTLMKDVSAIMEEVMETWDATKKPQKNTKEAAKITILR